MEVQMKRFSEIDAYVYGHKGHRYLCLVEEGKYKYYKMVDDEFDINRYKFCERVYGGGQGTGPLGWGLLREKYADPEISITKNILHFPLGDPELYGLLDMMNELAVDLGLFPQNFTLEAKPYDTSDHGVNFSQVKEFFELISNQSVDSYRKLTRLKGKDIYDLVTEVEDLANSLLDMRHYRQVAERENVKLNDELIKERKDMEEMKKKVANLTLERDVLLKEREAVKTSILKRLKEAVDLV